MGAKVGERIARQDRAAALEEEVRTLRELLEAKGEQLGRRAAEKERPTGGPLMGTLCVLGAGAALVTALAFVGSRRSAESPCVSLRDAMAGIEAPPFVAEVGPGRQTSLLDIRLQGRLESAPQGARAKKGDRCAIVVLGRRYGARSEVEEVSVTCGEGPPWAPGSVRVIHESIHADPRGPARRNERLDAALSAGSDRPPRVELWGVWRGDDGSRSSIDIGSTTARITTHSLAGVDESWSMKIDAADTVRP